MAADKPVLTTKQEVFCREYLLTNNASEAYRRAYNTSKMNEASVNKEAYALLRHPRIAPRIEKVREEVKEDTKITVKDHLDRLKDLSKKAESNGQYGPAITAEISRGKVSGLYVEKVETNNKHDVTVLSETERVAKLASIFASAKKRMNNGQP